MTLKKSAYAALAAAAAVAFVLGAPATGLAKGKKMMAPPPQPIPCFTAPAPVCGVKGGMKFTYVNACSAYKDGAMVVSKHACAVKKMHKAKKHKAKAHKAKKAMKKAPAKKASAKKKKM
jgi:hypothetical protein